jgi:malate dehydrogenase (oxaloacetate-decarboxylating)
MVKKDIAKEALALHKKLKGKIYTGIVRPIKTQKDLSLSYTPGVAAVSSYVAKNNAKAKEYTIKGRMVAVVSDGSAVLGLGNIGALGALPVMEGKCALFKTFADVDAFPIVLDLPPPRLRRAGTQAEIDFIVDTICAIAPAFGGINLEDFAAPRCFEIEKRLKERLDIPVMHDDQHGTAIAVVAGLINAAKVVKKNLLTMRIVIVGAGAAGTAVARLLHKARAREVVVLDSRGIIAKGRGNLSPHKKDLAKITNPRGLTGGVREALEGADVVIGVSGPNLITAKQIASMAKNSVVFALANPAPEITPEEAKKGGAKVIATGRSDYPNQINNSLVFPGVFRGALDNKVKGITDEMKLRAAKNLAALVKKPRAEKIIPTPFEKGITTAVARAIR